MNQELFYEWVRTRKPIHIVFFIVFILILSALWYTSGLGQLRLNSLIVDGNTVIEITDSQGNTESFIANGDSESKLLSRGDYTVSIINTNTSFIASVSVGRFLSTTNIDVLLKNESPRTFVADDTRSCFDEVSEFIISYSCGGLISSLVLHDSATQNTPTTAKKAILNNGQNIDSSKDLIEGVVVVNGQAFLLAKNSNSFKTRYNVYTINIEQGRPLLSFLYELNGLEDDEYRLVSRNQESLLLISESKGTIYKGADFQTIENIYRTDLSNIQELDINEEGEVLVVQPDGQTSGQEFELTYREANVLLETKQGTISSIKIDSPVVSGRFCGSHICVLTSDNTLRIYDKALQERGILDNITSFDVTNDGKIVSVTEKGIVEYDPETKTGALIYNNNLLKPLSVRVLQNGVFATIKSNKKEHLIKLGTGDYIDKTLSVFLENQFVDVISINRNNIFILPNLGERQFTEEGTYRYNKEVSDLAKNTINELLSVYSEALRSYSVFVAIP